MNGFETDHYSQYVSGKIHIKSFDDRKMLCGKTTNELQRLDPNGASFSLTTTCSDITTVYFDQRAKQATCPGCLSIYFSSKAECAKWGCD